jgi:hypothetical protein
MTTMKSKRGTRVTSLGLASVALAGVLVLAPNTAHAQEPDPVNVTGKGMVGGGLLGAEIVMIGIAIGGVKDWWPYVLFGAVGAGAGVAGGFGVESVTGPPDGPAEPGLYLLAGGMALVVPTLVAVLNATAYEPEDDDVEEQDSDDLPGDDLPGLDMNVEAGTEQGLIDIDAWRKNTRVRLMVPAVTMRPTYSTADVTTYGIEQRADYFVPIVSGAF